MCLYVLHASKAASQVQNSTGAMENSHRNGKFQLIPFVKKRPTQTVMRHYEFKLVLCFHLCESIELMGFHGYLTSLSSAIDRYLMWTGWVVSSNLFES